MKDELLSKDHPCITPKLQSLNEVLVLLKAIGLLPLAHLPILKNSLQFAQVAKVVQQVADKVTA